MNFKLLIILVVLSSCISKKNIINEERGPACSSPSEPIKIKSYYYISEYGTELIIKEKDTIFIDEIMVTNHQDTLRFSKIFKNIEMPEKCKSMHISGTTYYSIYINKIGAFSNLITLKNLDDCFISIYETILKNLNKYKVSNQKYFNTTIVFKHKLKLQ